MTVRELIAELSKYSPDAEVSLETCDNVAAIEHVALNTASRVKIFGEGWDPIQTQTRRAKMDWKAIAEALAAALRAVHNYDDGCGCCSRGDVSENEQCIDALAAFDRANKPTPSADDIDSKAS